MPYVCLATKLLLLLLHCYLNNEVTTVPQLAAEFQILVDRRQRS